MKIWRANKQCVCYKLLCQTLKQYQKHCATSNDLISKATELLKDKTAYKKIVNCSQAVMRYTRINQLETVALHRNFPTEAKVKS